MYWDRVRICRSDIQDTFADIQGSFVEIQGTFADIQGSFADIQGSFSPLHLCRICIRILCGYVGSIYQLYMAFLIIYRALLQMYRALLQIYRVLLFSFSCVGFALVSCVDMQGRDIRLFCRYIRLFCRYIRFFCRCIGLLCRYIQGFVQDSFEEESCASFFGFPPYVQVSSFHVPGSFIEVGFRGYLILNPMRHTSRDLRLFFRDVGLVCTDLGLFCRDTGLLIVNP